MVCFRSSVGSRGDAPAFPPSKPRRFRIATINIRNFRKKQASPRFPRRKNTLPDPNGAHYPAAACGARRGASRRAGLRHSRTFAPSDRNPPAPPTRSLSKPSSRDHPAAACGTYPAPAPEITRPQAAEHAQPQLTKPPGRRLRSTPRRKPTSGPPPGEAAARATLRSRTPSVPRHRPTPGLRSYRSAAFPPDAGHPSPPTPPPLPVPQHPCTPFPATRPAARHGTTPPSDPPQPRPPAARLLFSARRAPRHTGPPRKTPGTPHPATGHPTTRRSRCRSAERHRPVSLPKGASGNRRQRQPGRRPARAFHSDAFRHPPAPSAAFRYRPTTASSSSTVTGSRRSPSMRHPSSVTSRSSSMRMPPKSR